MGKAAEPPTNHQSLLDLARPWRRANPDQLFDTACIAERRVAMSNTLVFILAGVGAADFRTSAVPAGTVVSRR